MSKKNVLWLCDVEKWMWVAFEMSVASSGARGAEEAESIGVEIRDDTSSKVEQRVVLCAPY